ncbi:hypothetical protein [Granulicella sibirica]|uniref:Uncharacterized protein n=1 Tax=Granulicella sibirica TaxID=2479048 RepID=A0A4Q0T5R2_9BACT|nr:hypothetical protein [Granulicella sibirica]RXH57339.1 hypothetical protein GRAN_0649 [Granulicella sibirica]
MYESILYEIDAEISRLHASKAKLLKNVGTAHKKPGRPAKTVTAATKPTRGSTTRTMSAEGLERIRQAQFRRWAAVKKAKRAALRAASPTAKAKKRTAR